MLASAAAMLALAPMSFRPPSVPLVTHTPYFSVWSPNDRLTDGWTRHWTGANNAMTGMARIDGKPYRFMGPQPERVPAMTQKSVVVHPTRTIYVFEAEGVEFTAEFLSPLLPDDLEVYARPVTYLTVSVPAKDAQRVQVYLDTSAEWCVDRPSQRVYGSQHRVGELALGSLRSADQPVLGKAGDDLRIDWGTFYVGTGSGGRVAIASHQNARLGFARGEFPASDDLRFPRPANDDWPVIAAEGALDARGERTFLLAYDEDLAIEYFRRKLPPYWKRAGLGVDAMLAQAHAQAASLRQRCADFDASLMDKLRASGGDAYAQLGALAFRQCLAGHNIVQDLNGDLLMFSKENFSNGCIGTVDVTFPASPFFLYFSPEMLKAQIRPILDYAASPRWKFPFAPHDLGTYPLANGQVYGGGERTEDDQMPVEECGNMLLLVAGVCRADGSVDFARKYVPQIRQWTDYLLEKGLDPENQLCTDDFAGHLAHNANLSLKAILAVRATADVEDKLGDKARAKKLRDTSADWAKKWMTMAADGDHTKLAFDRPGTWSQKYNLLWDKLLGFKLFPAKLAQSELAFYLTKQNEFGLPLDSRADYTKSDWIVWTATLSDDPGTFRKFIDPLLASLHASPSRVPMTDWYDTKNARQIGFQARTVVGGVYAKLLQDSGRMGTK
jgi:hypothetical protein